MNHDDPVHSLLKAYFTGRATTEQLAQLEAWLRTDSANVRALVDLSLLDGLLLTDHKNKDASAVLAVLLEAEEAAEPIVVVAPPPADLAAVSPEAISWRQVGSALGYLALSRMRTKAVTIAAGVAALLVFTLILTFVFIGSPDPHPPQRVEAVPEANRETVTSVAVLTAVRDAQWQAGSGALLPGVGDGLQAGQKLFLRSGYAEITTAQGAVAVLSGPCEIELLDRDNALWLHHGKLVGLCYSEAAKGFVVQSEYADVIDLGTEFGVEVSADGMTATVFTGQIELAHPSIKPQRITTHQTARLTIEDNDRELTLEPRVAEGFADLRKRPAVTNVSLPVTGNGVSLGEIDPNWRVIAVDGKPLKQPKPLVKFHRTYQRSIPGSKAGWVEWDLRNDPAGEAEGLIPYTLQTTIELPESIDPDRAHVVMHYAVDDQLRSVRINGHETPVNGSLNLNKFAVQTTVLRDHFTPGINTIEFVVLNNQNHTHEDPGEVALIVDWHLIETPLPN